MRALPRKHPQPGRMNVLRFGGLPAGLNQSCRLRALAARFRALTSFRHRLKPAYSELRVEPNAGRMGRRPSARDSYLRWALEPQPRLLPGFQAALQPVPGSERTMESGM